MRLRDQGRQEEAEACLREGMKIGQAVVSEDAERASYRLQVADIHRNLGLLLTVAGRTAEAEPSFQQAVGQYAESIQRQPDEPIGYESLARLLATCPLSSVFVMLPQAMSIARPLVQQMPQDPTFQLTLGVACYRAGSLARQSRRLPSASDKDSRPIPGSPGDRAGQESAGSSSPCRTSNLVTRARHGNGSTKRSNGWTSIRSTPRTSSHGDEAAVTLGLDERPPLSQEKVEQVP